MKAVVLRNLRSAITLGLMFWCAGAGCVIVSVAHGAAMSGADTTQMGSSMSGWGQASGSMGTHDCCKARHASERRVVSSISDHAPSSQSLVNLEGLAETPNSSNAKNCCPLTSGTIVVTGRQRVNNDDTSVSPDPDAVAVVTSAGSTPLTMPLRLPDQAQTYLRGCVFLI
jgi:hypothetical protein